jgi:hypothetical protein
MKTFSVEEIRTRLIKDTPDEELMQSYGLSPNELRCLYDRLVRAMAHGSSYVHIGNDTN